MSDALAQTTDAPGQWASRIVGHSRVDPASLVANPLNWRAHPRNQREALKGALEDLGFIRSVSVNRNSGLIVDGHLRVAVAKEQQQPLIDVEWLELTPDEERLALASFDSIAGMARAETAKLDSLLRSIGDASEATRLFIADFGKKNGLRLEQAPQTDDQGPQLEKAAALQTKWQTRLGQLWLIPSTRHPGLVHRLLIGDSTSAADVARVMGRHDPGMGGRLEPANWLAPSQREEADIVVTDPPYGVDYVGKTRDALTIQNDNRGHLGTRMLIRDAAALWPLKPGGAWYVNAPAGDMELSFRLGLDDAQQPLHQSLVWIKHHFVMGRQDYHWRHESILYGWNPGAGHYFVPSYTQDTVVDDSPDPHAMTKPQLLELVAQLRRERGDTTWYEDRPSASVLHPTTKPVALVQRCLRNSSRPGEIVYDGFAGSGTTLVTAELTQRAARVIEIEAKYGACVLERASLLGLYPVLEGEQAT